MFGCAITLDEPGSGLLKVEIQNVLHSIPNYLLWDWMSQFGSVVEVKSEKHKFKNGRRVSWGTGIRTVWVKHVRNPIPPVGSVPFRNKNINFSVWYFGQTDMKCHHCKSIVLKGHHCSQAPQKRCFSCGSTTHMRSECTVGKRALNPLIRDRRAIEGR